MITGIDCITYGVEDLGLCRKFFTDWGLTATGDNDFETLNGCEVKLRAKDDPSLPPPMEAGPTLREVIFASDKDLPAMTDPNGMALKFRESRKRKIDAKGVPINTFDNPVRIDAPSAFYDRAQPVEVGHLVLFTDKLAEMERFYVEKLGFIVSDRYPNRGVFMRSTPIRRCPSPASITSPSRFATSTRCSAAACTSAAAAGPPRSARDGIRCLPRISGT
jgi:hypothetical protein